MKFEILNYDMEVIATADTLKEAEKLAAKLDDVLEIVEAL